jgi:hypothetical protein
MRSELEPPNSEGTSPNAGAETYFTVVRQALADLVDGKHFFDVVADNIACEVLYELGWPWLIQGRANLMT